MAIVLAKMDEQGKRHDRVPLLPQSSSLFPLRTANADAPGHDDFLNIGGTTGMQTDHRRALIMLQ